MTAPSLNQLDRDVIESVLQMGNGYVLDLSDRTFAEFFRDFGVPIDEQRFRVDGDSKAKRFRVFLRTAPQPLVARVLALLLERRLLKAPAGLKEQEVTHYRGIVLRLGGTTSAPGATQGVPVDSEAELLRHAFKPDRLRALPLDAALVDALVDRMREAHACIDAKAFLSTVILCGSVLEGLCLGVGIRDRARAGRAFTTRYNRPAPPFPEWKLVQWIEVLASLGDLSPNVEKFGHALRDFRNYVHPAEQLAHRFTPDAHTARIAFHVVVAAIDDLARACAPATTSP